VVHGCGSLLADWTIIDPSDKYKENFFVPITPWLAQRHHAPLARDDSSAPSSRPLGRMKVDGKLDRHRLKGALGDACARCYAALAAACP